MTSPEIITTARLIVLDEYDRLIMGIRPVTSKQRKGDFDFFGGRIDQDEDHLSGLIREVLEETGMVVDPGKIVPCYKQTDTDGRMQFNREYSLYEQRLSISAIKQLPEHIGAVCISRCTALDLTGFIPHQRAISRLEQL